MTRLPGEVESAVAGAIAILAPNTSPGSTLAIIGSTDIERAYYQCFVAAAVRLGIEPVVGLMLPRAAPGLPAPRQIAACARESDTVLLTGSASLAHSATALDALNAGRRVITFPVPMGHGAALAYLAAQRSYDIGRLEHLRETCASIAELLDAGRTVHATSPLGTDLTVSIDGRTSHPWYGIADAYGHNITAWPPGECHVAAVETSATGVAVADGYISGLGVSHPPLELRFEDGVLVDLTGGAADRLGKVLAEFGDSARILCEIGIGVNPWQQVIGTNADKNAVGTWHLAIGTNASACFGGTEFDGQNSSSVHLDLVTASQSSLSIDGNQILTDGHLRLGRHSRH